MPHYDYRCQECGREFEVFQNMSDPLLKECETCGGSVERLMSAGTGLIFKGSGFYITDYKNKNNGKPGETNTPTATNGSPESSTAESTKGDATKTDSKPEAKTSEKSASKKTEAKTSSTSSS